MTEREWLACTDPGPMLEALRGRASSRKLVLLGVACYRRVWDQLRDEAVREVVEVAERYADGQATARDLQNAVAEALGPLIGEPIGGDTDPLDLSPAHAALERPSHDPGVGLLRARGPGPGGPPPRHF